MPNAGKYKGRLLQGKGFQIQIIKQLLNSVLVGYEELLRPRLRYLPQPSADNKPLP